MRNIIHESGAGLGATGLLGLMLIFSAAASAAPGENSVADIVACSEGDGTVRACSSKELSNVVLECSDGESSFYVKFDDLDSEEDPYPGLDTPYEGTFSCPGGGDVLAVFVKSGSGKFDGAGAPSGSGTLWDPDACPAECPETGEDGEDPGTDPGPGGETPQ